MRNLKKIIVMAVAIGVLGIASVAFAATIKTWDSQVLEDKKTILNQRVQDGDIKQEDADEIFGAFKNDWRNCHHVIESRSHERRHNACFEGRSIGRGMAKHRHRRVRKGYSR